MNGKQKILSIFTVLLLFFSASIPVSLADAVDPDDNTGYEPENPGILDEQTDEGDKGMVVTAHPLASEVGADVLRRGGNAVDAAVAIQFALNVAEPMMSGIGGGGFFMYYDAQSEDVSIINSRERAPQGATPDMFLDQENVVTDPGKFHLGAIDMNPDGEDKQFHIGEVNVTDLEASGEEATVFDYGFASEAGEPWDPSKFSIFERGTTFQLDEDGGLINFGPPTGSNSSSYGQTTAVMDEVEDSELFIRYRTDDPGDDRRLRLWLRSDEYRSTGTTFVKNGYGVEINTKTNQISLIQSKDSTTSTLATFSYDGTTDWQSLRFRVEGDELKVRLWEDGAEEPEDWNIETFAGSVIPFSERVQSGTSVGVPGTLKGLEEALDKWGTMELGELIQPSIDMAEQGVEVNWVLANAIANNQSKLERTAAKDVFLPEGEPLEEGEILVQEDLAKTFKLIRDQGIDVFYNGEIGEALAEAVQEFDGSMVMEDLGDYDVTEDEAVWGDYLDYDIASMPPPSSGGLTMLQLLKMFEQLDLTDHDVKSSEKYHFMAEAMHLAYADRGAYMGDPEYVEVPRDGLLHQDYIAERVETISPDRANDNVQPGDPWEYQEGSAPTIAQQVDDKQEGQTTHYTVADQWGNLVSNTTTIEQLFGSGIMVPEYGIVLNNELTDFDAVPGGANEVQPNKRPLSSMTPTIVLKDGEPFMTVGSPGGATIITSVTQTIANVIGYGMSIKDAIEEPRIYSNSYPTIRWEYGISDAVRQLLEEMGHAWEASPTEIGNVNSIVLDEGIFIGAADSTREGTAIGLSAADFLSIDGLKSRVEQLHADDEIYEEHVVRLLLTHLTTVGHYEENEKMDKAIKHLEGFKQLLDQLKAADSISEHAHETLVSGAEELLDMWQ
ncbi:gamma-glutamyltransferase [Oceanobacillus polygoni]|uniref:Gamma-glutamyltranspeptidase/glutathione hydrolase n=1 Tax=Oceanobacillus polygoni TaxID=1235259 RepID=A0A9X1CD42_9BACI|nr:gamma-glutamyltransferase [Oceanobacillus polygoni]MBP2078656.1 gamma-glutamyltranspeptidase/glutathione hydrolase [Oceanobacillus polygoni]